LLIVTEVVVTLVTVVPAGMFVPVTDIPANTPVNDPKGSVEPEGVSVLVGRDIGAGAGVSQVEFGVNASSSLRYATGPSGDVQGGGTQLVREPSGFTGTKPPAGAVTAPGGAMIEAEV
jgi:hypothetical protein